MSHLSCFEDLLSCNHCHEGKSVVRVIFFPVSAIDTSPPGTLWYLTVKCRMVSCCYPNAGHRAKMKPLLEELTTPLPML